eukprot:COSAG02_NODE_108_length_36286_cov_19.437478_4_plen_379_part_00
MESPGGAGAAGEPEGEEELVQEKGGGGSVVSDGAATRVVSVDGGAAAGAGGSASSRVAPDAGSQVGSSAALATEIEALRARLGRGWGTSADRRDAFRAMNEARRLMAKVREMPAEEPEEPEVAAVRRSRLEKQRATVIQARWRGGRGRRHLLAELAAQEEELAAQAAAKEAASALKIQAYWRGTKGRRQFVRELERQEQDLQNRMSALGLTAGDAAYRGPSPWPGCMSTAADADGNEAARVDERNDEADATWVEVSGPVAGGRTQLGSYLVDQQQLAPTPRKVSLKEASAMTKKSRGRVSSQTSMMQSMDSALSGLSDTVDEGGTNVGAEPLRIRNRSFNEPSLSGVELRRCASAHACPQCSGPLHIDNHIVKRLRTA